MEGVFIPEKEKRAEIARGQITEAGFIDRGQSPSQALPDSDDWPVMTRSGLKEAICSQVFWIHSSSIFSRAALQGQ